MVSKFFKALLVLFVISMICPMVLGDLDATAQRVFSSISVEYHGASQLLPQDWAHELTYNSTNGTLSFPEKVSFPLDKDDLDESYMKFFLDTGNKTHTWKLQIEPGLEYSDDKTIRFTVTYTDPADKTEVCEEIQDLTNNKIIDVPNCKIKFSAEWVSWSIIVPDADVKIRNIVFNRAFVAAATAEVLENTNNEVLDTLYSDADKTSKVISSLNIQLPSDFRQVETAYVAPLGDWSETVLVDPGDVGVVNAYLLKLTGYEFWQPGLKFDSEGKKAPREYLIVDGKKLLFLIFANQKGDIQSYGVSPGFENVTIDSDIFKASNGELNKTRIVTWNGWDRATLNTREDVLGGAESILSWVAISSVASGGVTYSKSARDATKFARNIQSVFKAAAATPVAGETAIYGTSGILHTSGRFKDFAYTTGKQGLKNASKVGPKALEASLAKQGIKATVAEVTSASGKPALRATAKTGVGKILSKAFFWVALVAETAYLEINFAANKLIFVGDNSSATKMFFTWNEDMGNIEGRVMFLGVTKIHNEPFGLSDSSGEANKYLALDFKNSIAADLTIEKLRGGLEFYSAPDYFSGSKLDPGLMPVKSDSILLVDATKLNLPITGMVEGDVIYLKLTYTNAEGKDLIGKSKIIITNHNMGAEVVALNWVPI